MQVFFCISPCVWPNSGFWCCVFLNLWKTLIYGSWATVQNMGLPLQRGYTTVAASALCIVHNTHWTWLWVSGYFFSFCEICKRMVFFGGKNYHILEITKLWIIKEKKKKKPLENQASFDCVCKGEVLSCSLHIGQFIFTSGTLLWIFFGKIGM